MSKINGCDLFFSGDGVHGFRMRALDGITIKSLERLGELCGLTATPAAGEADALLSAGKTLPEAAEKVEIPQKYRRIAYYRLPAGNFFIQTPTGRTPDYFAFEGQKLLLFAHAAAIAKKENASFNLMHGALLEESGNSCTLLFGESGIGKSTSVRRYRAGGGSACADDMFFLYTKEGKFFARRMPTWSAVVAGKNEKCYDFNTEFAVRRVLLLLRDDQVEHIGEVSVEQYKLSLLKSASETSNWLLPFMPERGAVVDHLLNFCSCVCRNYSPRAFFANLGFDIMASLAAK